MENELSSTEAMEKKSLQEEINLFYKTTTIMISLDSARKAENKNLNYLIDLLKDKNVPDYASKKADIMKNIDECRKAI